MKQTFFGFVFGVVLAACISLSGQGSKSPGAPTAGGCPGGSSGQVQFNASGSCAGSGSFTINASTGKVTIGSGLQLDGDVTSNNLALLHPRGIFQFAPTAGTIQSDRTFAVLRSLWAGATNLAGSSAIHVLDTSTDQNAFSFTGYVENTSPVTNAVGLVGAGISSGNDKGPTFGANLIVSNRPGDLNSHLVGAEIDVSPLQGTTLVGSGALDLRIVSLDNQAYGINLATGGGGGKWSNGIMVDDVTATGAGLWIKSGRVILNDLQAAGAAGGKRVVCVDASGRLYASSTGTDCSN